MENSVPADKKIVHFRRNLENTLKKDISQDLKILNNFLKAFSQQLNLTCHSSDVTEPKKNYIKIALATSKLGVRTKLVAPSLLKKIIRIFNHREIEDTTPEISLEKFLEIVEQSCLDLPERSQALANAIWRIIYPPIALNIYQQHVKALKQLGTKNFINLGTSELPFADVHQDIGCFQIALLNGANYEMTVKLTFSDAKNKRGRITCQSRLNPMLSMSQDEAIELKKSARGNKEQRVAKIIETIWELVVPGEDNVNNSRSNKRLNDALEQQRRMNLEYYWVLDARQEPNARYIFDELQKQLPELVLYFIESNDHQHDGSDESNSLLVTGDTKVELHLRRIFIKNLGYVPDFSPRGV